MISLARRLSLPGTTCRHPDVSGSHTTMGIGGRVAMTVQVESPASLAEVLRILGRCGRPHLLLGGGSNIVFPENAPDLVLVLNRTRGIRRPDDFHIRVLSGETNLSLMAWCAAHGVTGLEFLAGIPGTIGGAAAVNAGAFGAEMADCFTEARILDPEGREKRVTPEDCGFQYRDSRFKRGPEVLLEIVLEVKPDDPAAVRQRIRRHFNYRREHHPTGGIPTAGCFFKNPRRDPRGSAGRLIDAAGLGGFRIDGLEVSSRHANFILHHGGAGITELEAFYRQIAARVEAAHGIRLEREVLFVAPDGTRY